MPSGRDGAGHLWAKGRDLGLRESQWRGKIRDKHRSIGGPLGRGKMFEHNALPALLEVAPSQAVRNPGDLSFPAFCSAASCERSQKSQFGG